MKNHHIKEDTGRGAPKVSEAFMGFAGALSYRFLYIVKLLPLASFRIIIFLAAVFTVSAFLFPLADIWIDMAEIILNGFNISLNDGLESLLRFAHSLIYIACIIIGISFGAFIAKKVSGNKVIRDRDYLKSRLRADGNRFPPTSLDELVDRITGDHLSDSDNTRKVRKTITQNINGIKVFLENGSKDAKTLVVSGRWGSGKTTAILIAIDQLSEEKEMYRYIYASAFKYSGGIKSFEKVVAAAIGDVLWELGIKEKWSLNGILQNIEPSISGTLIRFFQRTTGVSGTLTTDYVGRINDAYSKSAKKVKLVIILDDLDRLQGQDLLGALSLLSVIRRFSFVKIILPLDFEAVTHHLQREGVYQPSTYIRKYLPEQRSIEIKTSKSIVEETVRNIILTRLQIKGRYAEGVVNEIYSAVMMKVIARRFERSTRAAGLFDLGEFFPSVIGLSQIPAEYTKMENSCILDAPFYMARALIENGSVNAIDWTNNNRGELAFEDILCKVVTSERRRNKNKNNDEIIKKEISDYNTYEVYSKLVEPWLQKYLNNYWDEMGINMREVLDVIDEIDYRKVRNSFSRFSDTFNQLFPDNKIINDMDF